MRALALGDADDGQERDRGGLVGDIGGATDGFVTGPDIVRAAGRKGHGQRQRKKRAPLHREISDRQDQLFDSARKTSTASEMQITQVDALTKPMKVALNSVQRVKATLPSVQAY